MNIPKVGEIWMAKSDPDYLVTIRSLTVVDGRPAVHFDYVGGGSAGAGWHFEEIFMELYENHRDAVLNAARDSRDETEAPRDMKEALTSSRKPDLSHMGRSTMIYDSRAKQYGLFKQYGRGNYLRQPDTIAEAWEQQRAYLAANQRHVTAILESMEAHQALDPNLEDIEGMRAAIYCADTDDDGRHPPSGLPHICGAIASLDMGLRKAIGADFLPPDPGCPWQDCD